MRIIFLTSVVFIILITSPAYSEEPGEGFTHPFGFVLNKSTLNNIQKVLGPSQIIKEGDAGDYSATICYSLPNQHILEFKAGELSGADLDVLEFVVREPKLNEKSQCTPLPKDKLELENTTLGGLSLGMSKEGVIKTVGEPTKSLKDELRFKFSRKEEMSQKQIKEMNAESYPYWDIIITVVARFKNSRLMQLSIAKTETY